MNLAGRVQVGPRQLPDLHALYLGVAARLGVDPAPPLFLQPGGIQASTAGVERPFVLVSELTVSLLSPPELEFVLGHELGHVRFDHVLHLTLAQLLRAPGALLAEIPFVGPALRHGAELALFDWQRKAELSCDRAGLLACQDLDAGLRVLMRLSGAPHGMVHRMDPEVWLEQHAALEGQQSALLGRLGYALSTVTRTHPWAVVRARRLADWARGGELDALLAECPIEPPDPWAPAAGPACPACGAPRAPDDRFCTACGAPLGDDL
jgi:Zn-dependent protease with chaperone function